MDEASLCDRIALINKGEFIGIDTPQNIIANFTDTLFSVEGDNMYQLLLDLRKNPMVKTCFAFGDTLHVVLATEAEPQPNAKKQKAESRRQKAESDEKNLTLLHSYALTVSNNVIVKQIEPNIEDCYMKLSCHESD
jgi:ABC-type multidrug transport system ATPase subunit